MLSTIFCLALLLFHPIVIFSFNNSSSTELLGTKTTIPPNENQRMFYAIISGGNPWEIQKHDSKEFNKKVEEIYKQNLTDTQETTEEISSTVVTTVAKRGKHYDTSWRWGLVSGCAFFLAAIVIVLGWEHCGDEDQAD
uniref:Uncharacterized protein n=1 Tax=Meloidogyne enterolobii TaxID=390850 RepID=A0A6V7XND8_MELEN|nr:unnamed protein product [Meloidogyne enterolobii]